MQSLSNIILLEIRSNVDFMKRIEDNLKSRYFKLPESFIYHICSKYCLNSDSIRELEPQIIEFISPIFNVQYTNTKKKTLTLTKKKVLADIPAAQFQN
jgi:hypothetical protein